jgi:hypothetical protein
LTNFICISGKARHGKDTVGGIIADLLKGKGYKVLVTHYADLVKYICEKFFDWNGNKDEAGRSLLQYVGTDKVREWNPNYWVHFIISIVTVFEDKWDYVIIPDARFPNEIEEIRKANYPVMHISVVRSDFENELTESQQKHSSETSMDKVIPDYCIINDGLDSLWHSVARLYPEIAQMSKGG